VRRGLSPGDLGDLFDQPLTAVLSMARPDGTVFSRPVWHRFADGRFVFQFPAGDRKIAMIERDPRATVLLAEDAFPYRAIEVRGRIRVTSADYHRIGSAICEPYVQAFDPTTDVAAYLSEEPGVIVELEPAVTTCWDYADDAMMPPTASPSVT
jgi:nitroimidazol reductase NimA-like FMN-containing flavoprotein (pyridoxamine 5'-phosphate oxidase superfamily)